MGGGLIIREEQARQARLGGSDWAGQ
eukprot:SAG31_NODE_16797_length_695_cov_1.563758_2_plen_25_part_01